MVEHSCDTDSVIHVTKTLVYYLPKKFRNGIHRPQGEENFVVLYTKDFPYRKNPAHNCQNFTTQDSTKICTQHNPMYTLNAHAKTLSPINLNVYQ